MSIQVLQSLQMTQSCMVLRRLPLKICEIISCPKRTITITTLVGKYQPYTIDYSTKTCIDVDGTMPFVLRNTGHVITLEYWILWKVLDWKRHLYDRLRLHFGQSKQSPGCHLEFNLWLCSDDNSIWSAELSFYFFHVSTATVQLRSVCKQTHGTYKHVHRHLCDTNCVILFAIKLVNAFRTEMTVLVALDGWARARYTLRRHVLSWRCDRSIALSVVGSGDAVGITRRRSICPMTPRPERSWEVSSWIEEARRQSRVNDDDYDDSRISLSSCSSTIVYLLHLSTISQ